MNNRYETELSILENTYKRALEIDINKLNASIESSIDCSLIAVGSGGSLTVANLASLLHTKFTGQISTCMTPFEFISYENPMHDVSIFLFTAGGRNSDILSVFKEAVYREPLQLTIVCSTKNSPISKLANRYRYVRLIELEDLPFKKDGYLATNSLLAFSTILTRAYLSTFNKDSNLPNSLKDLVYGRQTFDEYLTDLTENLTPLLAKDTLTVLYGNWSRPAAIDMESKFTEAALGNVKVSDYRNFGHGRHYWLAKYSDSTSVLAFVDNETKDISKRTLDLIPPDVLTLQLSVDHTGPVSSLAHLCNVLYAVKLAGDIKGIDPGKPGVPKFGRRLYSLCIRTKEMPTYSLLSKSRNRYLIPILRKAPQAFRDSKLLNLWMRAYLNFINKLERAKFSSIVFDYDGTLCEPEERFRGPSDEIINELIRLVESGVTIGIATGRGKSVRKDLQKRIPKELWDNILIGYYNASDIARLSENDHPVKSKDLDPMIESIDGSLKDSWINEICKWESRPHQISIIEVKKPFTIKKLRDILTSLINQERIRIFESLHSIDILAPGVSKHLLVDMIRKIRGGEVLCIGDMGKYPGNDFELLSKAYSLSVYEVSSDPNTCWNIASPGYRFTQATLEYLKSLAIKNYYIRFKFREGYKNER